MEGSCTKLVPSFQNSTNIRPIRSGEGYHHVFVKKTCSEDRYFQSVHCLVHGIGISCSNRCFPCRYTFLRSMRMGLVIARIPMRGQWPSSKGNSMSGRTAGAPYEDSTTRILIVRRPISRRSCGALCPVPEHGSGCSNRPPTLRFRISRTSCYRETADSET